MKARPVDAGKGQPMKQWPQVTPRQRHVARPRPPGPRTSLDHRTAELHQTDPLPFPWRRRRVVRRHLPQRVLHGPNTSRSRPFRDRSRPVRPLVAVRRQRAGRRRDGIADQSRKAHPAQHPGWARRALPPIGTLDRGGKPVQYPLLSGGKGGRGSTVLGRARRVGSGMQQHLNEFHGPVQGRGVQRGVSASSGPSLRRCGGPGSRGISGQ